MKTLLLAESHPATLAHLEASLSQAGYAVRAFTEPGTALEHFVSNPPDAVVVGVDFPRMHGEHLGQLIRRTQQGAWTPIIAIDRAHLGRARGVGSVLELKVNAYVADPLKSSELNGRLEALLVAAQGAKAANADGVSAVLARPPTASGELKSWPLPAVLHSAFRVPRDGVLVVAHRELVRRLYFLRGVPVNYDSTARQDSLAAFLQERGVVSQAQAEGLLKALGAGQRIGMALAEIGTPMEGEELLQLLRDYTRDRTAQLIGMRDGRYAFYSGTEFAKEIATVEIPALAPILEGARRTFPLRVFAQPLKPYLDQFPHRSPDFGRDLGALALSTSDLKIAMQMNGRIPLRDLLAHGRGELKHAYALAWFLQLTGDIAFAKAPLPVSAHEAYAGADRIAPRKRKPLPADTVKELREAAVKIITGSYFRVLGLDIAADTEAVERAYHEVATRFHPDSYPEYDTSEIQDLLDSVQDKLSASYRVLSVDEKRRAYLQYLFSRLDTGRTAGMNVDAEIALKRGEAALRRKDAKSAAIAFEEAIQLNPREPEYYCYLAWATYLSGGADRKERAKAAQKSLKKALSLNPYLERALVISAIIEGEQGDHSTARRKLLKVLEMNPNAQLAKAALRRVGR